MRPSRAFTAGLWVSSALHLVAVTAFLAPPSPPSPPRRAEERGPHLFNVDVRVLRSSLGAGELGRSLASRSDESIPGDPSGRPREAPGRGRRASSDRDQVAQGARFAVEVAGEEVAAKQEGSVPQPSASSQPVYGPEPELVVESPGESPAGGGTGDNVGDGNLGGAATLSPLVQERVTYVSQLVGPSAVHRAGREGFALVRFRVESGYVGKVEVIQGTGSPSLDKEIPAILHLAEPYPADDDWFKVAVPFVRKPLQN